MSIREDPQVLAFKEAAQHYCGLLSSVPTDPQRWVETILAALSRVYTAGHTLPDLELSDSALDVPDSLDVQTEEWSSVFALAQNVLGKQEAYRAYWYPSDPRNAEKEPDLRSLANDLADIYRDVMPGLRAWDAREDRYLETIVFDWRDSFTWHWGPHAVCAMSALHPIAFQTGLSISAEPSASPNRGPAAPTGSSGAMQGPPSVSQRFCQNANMTTKLLFLVTISCLLSWAAGAMLLRRELGHELLLVALGALTGWSAVACRGRLPAWLRVHWGITDDSDPRNLPVRIWLPILAMVIVVAGLLFWYVVRF
jgi:hypothetical protein